MSFDLVHGDLYKPDRQLFHIDGGFDLGDTSYSGSAHLERDSSKTVIKLKRLIHLGKSGAKTGYDFSYERKPDATGQAINAHLTLQSPAVKDPVEVFRLTSDFDRKKDHSDATLTAKLAFLMITRSPPVREEIDLTYSRRSVKPANQAKRLLSPEAQLKLEVKTKSNVFKALIDHSHRRSSEASPKGSFSFFSFDFSSFGGLPSRTRKSTTDTGDQQRNSFGCR